MSAKRLLRLYQNKGWDAFIAHPETSVEMENVLILAVANKKTDLALKILETVPQLSDSGRQIFTTCCKTNQWDVAYALVDQTSKTNDLVQNFMGSEALEHKNVDLLEHILKRSEVKSSAVYLLLQKYANPKHSDPEIFKKLLQNLLDPNHQEQLCVLFLWKEPPFAKIMLQEMPDLFFRMAKLKIFDSEAQENFETFYAEHQKDILNSTMLGTESEKTDKRIKKI